MTATISSTDEFHIALEGVGDDQSWGGNHSQEGGDRREFVPLSDGGFAFLGLMLTTNYVLGSFINALCLFVFAKHKHLRSATNIFVMALNLCDFLMCFIGTPLSMTSAWSHGWLWGPVGCNVEAFTVYVLGLASMYILTAISFDRYIAISKPLTGHKITKKVAISTAGGCFLFGMLWSIFPLVGWNEYALEGAGISCSIVWYNTDPVYQSYIWTIFFFCFFFPLGIMIYSYAGVLNTLHNLNKTSVWDVNSRIGRRNLAIEKKMFKTSVMIVGSFLGCWMSYTVISLISALGYAHIIPNFMATVPPVIAKCQGFIDPLIYVAMNKQFRMAFYELLPCPGLKHSLLADEKDKPVEEESEESDVEEDPQKNSSKKKSKTTANAGGGGVTSGGGEPAKTSEKDGKGDNKKAKSGKKKSSSSRNAVHALQVPTHDEVSEEGVSQISMLDAPGNTTSIQILPAPEGATVSYSSGEKEDEG